MLTSCPPRKRGPVGPPPACGTVALADYNCSPKIMTFHDDFLRTPEANDPTWNIITAGSGTVQSVADRSNGWWRLRVADPQAGGEAKIVSRVPIVVPSNSPTMQVQVSVTFPENEQPEFNEEFFCTLSKISIGITDRPDLGSFNLGSPGNAFFMENPFAFDPNCWDFWLITGGSIADTAICAPRSIVCTEPNRIQFFINTKPPPITSVGPGHGGAINGDVLLPGDLDPGCFPASFGTAYYLFAAVSIPPSGVGGAGPQGDYSGIATAVCPDPPPATHPLAMDIDFWCAFDGRECNEVGGTFTCP